MPYFCHFIVTKTYGKLEGYLGKFLFLMKILFFSEIFEELHATATDGQ